MNELKVKGQSGTVWFERQPGRGYWMKSWDASGRWDICTPVEQLLLEELRQDEGKLISLRDHDEIRRALHKGKDGDPKPNGIACLECLRELVDVNPTTHLLSNPPKKSIRCQCGFEGTRVA